MLRLILLISSFSLSIACLSQKIDDGTYISHRIGIVPKYTILVVSKDSTTLEIFTKWQGWWLPAIGNADSSYHAQILNSKDDGSLSNENAQIVKTRKDKLKCSVKTRSFGRFNFQLKKVDRLPTRFEKIRNKGINFTKG